MTESIDLNASIREVVGKANRRLPGGRLPGVLYGDGHKAQAVSVHRPAFPHPLPGAGPRRPRLPRAAREPQPPPPPL